MDDNELDRAIDEAAHGLTAGEPDASFRARVVARLDDRQGRRLSLWIWSPVAAAAVLAIALTIRREPERQTPAAATAPAALPSRTIAFAASVRGRDPGVMFDTPRPLAARRGLEESVVAGLAPEPLDVPSIALSALEDADSLELQKLEPIAPMVLAPIGEPEGERR